MRKLLAILLIIIILLFGFTSISQSFSAAQQAQAAIEASRATQIANTSNLLVIIALLVILFVTILGGSTFMIMRAKQPARPQQSQITNGQGLPRHTNQDLLTNLLALYLVEQMRHGSPTSITTLPELEDEYADVDIWNL